MPTLFEKIIAGELPANVLYRDSRVIAFLDIRPFATMRTASPGRKPNSARRRPNSTGVVASAAATDTTRARVPGASSVSRMAVAAPGGKLVCPVVNMNAMLYENRSHYY